MEKLEKPEKKIEIISGHTDVKESDKQEGIDIYGGKPLGEKEGNYIHKKTAQEISQEISELEKSWKSTNYVGDKSSIEKEIAKLENELQDLEHSSNKKLKTSKELAMEGNIAWEKNTEKDETEPKQGTKETTEAEIKKTEETKAKDKKLYEELKEAGFNKDQIENLTTKKTEIEKENIPPAQKDSKIENKEQYSREQLLNAAEVFCKYNSAAYYKDPIEQKIAQERALSELREKHSEREIAAAVNVSTKRNEMFGLKDKIKRIEEEYKNARENPNAEISTVKAKYDQQIQNIKREMRLIDNDYNPLLRELKIANLDSQLKNLEKYRDHKDFKEKTQDAELFALSMIQTEMVRYQDAKVSSNSVINPKGWDHIKNFFKRSIGENRFFQGYMKMGKGKRMAISAAIIGATSGFVPITLVAGAISLVAGGVGGYLLSKKIFQPLARKAYEHDSARTTQSQQNEALASSEMAHLEELARGETDPTEREKILSKIADFNIELCSKYSDKIRRDKKYYIANNVLGTVAAGLIAGRGARLMGNWIAGSGILGVGGKTTIPVEHTPHKGGGVAPIPGEEHIPKGGGGTAPETILPPKPTPTELNPDDMKAATIGKGEGIEHALRRQLEMHPDKFGFKGDITNKAAVHEWSGGKADVIARSEHYVNANGTETWVKDMGPAGPEGNPAYVLDVDATGKPTIHEYFEGKPSGVGGPNSPYEYMHDTPASPRYTSALDNVPEQNSGGNNGEIIEYGDNDALETGQARLVETEYEDTSINTDGSQTEILSNQAVEHATDINNAEIFNLKNLQATHFTEQSWADAPENIYHIPLNKLQEIENLRTNNLHSLNELTNKMTPDLSYGDRTVVIDKINSQITEGNADAFIGIKENGVNEIYHPLYKYINILHNESGLEPIGRTLTQAGETNQNYIIRTLMKVASEGNLDKVKL